MIEIGDVTRISTTIKDINGNAATPTTLTLTITLPDGSTVSYSLVSNPALSTDGTGLYHYDYQTLQSGRHAYLWSATGANAGAFADSFYVTPTDPGLLIGLDEARRGLGKIPATDTVNDEDLRTYIQAATPIMEDLVGVIIPKTFTEAYDGGAPSVALLNTPVISITSVTESYGAGYQRTLTLQNLFNQSALSAFGYTVDYDPGIVYRRTAGISCDFAEGRQNIQIAYTAGRTAALLPGNVLLATRRLVRHLYQSEKQGERPPAPGSGAQVMGFTPSGYAVPQIVIELCAAETAIPGIG